MDLLEELKSKIKERPYLTINGRAVCLARTRMEVDKLEYMDKFFSETLLEHPVRCEQGHLFEKEYAEFWLKKFPQLCPAGTDHGILDLTVDEKVEQAILEYTKGKEEEIREMDELIEQSKKSELQELRDETKIKLLRAFQILNINTVIYPNPSKSQVERAYRTQYKQFHSDRIIREIELFTQHYISPLILVLEQAKAFIYHQKDWQ